MSVLALADASEVSSDDLAAIEDGRTAGNVAACRSQAAVLGIAMDDPVTGLLP